LWGVPSKKLKDVVWFATSRKTGNRWGKTGHPQCGICNRKNGEIYQRGGVNQRFRQAKKHGG